MSLYNKGEELVETKRYYKKPSAEIHNLIDSSEKKKIILSGKSGSGKTTTLKGYVKEKNDTIYIEGKRSFYESIIGTELLRKRYEILISLYLLEFAKNQDEEVFENYFAAEDKHVRGLLKEIDDFIFARTDRLRKFRTDILVGHLIDKIKNVYNLDNLNIIIDNFDDIASSSLTYQMQMRDIIKQFDKYIITTEDPEIVYRDKKRIDKLVKNNWDIIPTNYAKEEQTARKIVSKDLAFWQEHRHLANPYVLPDFKEVTEMISEGTYKNLIRNANGDMNSIFAGIKPLYDLQYVTIVNPDAEVMYYQHEYFKEEKKKEKKKLHI